MGADCEAGLGMPASGRNATAHERVGEDEIVLGDPPTDFDAESASEITGTYRNILSQTGISEIFYIGSVSIEPMTDRESTYTVTHHHDCHNGTQLLAVYELVPTDDATWEELPQPVETSGECETSDAVDVTFEYTGPVVWTLEADGSLRRVAPMLSHPNEVEFDDASVWERVDEGS